MKTEEDAIRIGKRDCSNALNLPPNWHARLEGDMWIVRNEQDRDTYIEERIRKSNGGSDNMCRIAFPTD